MNLAVIPARGGSKRIPRKNIKPFCGKPMIAWSIEAALASGCFDRVIVSTDDEEIAAVAREYGAEVPFMRSAELADDHTGLMPVMQHAILAIEKNVTVDLVCCCYATAPFLSFKDITKAFEIIKDAKDCDYVIPVTTFPSPIQRALKISKSQTLEMFEPHYLNSRSQDLEESYHDAALFSLGKKGAWFSNRHPFLAKSVPLVIPRYRVQDIDTEEDWVKAEILFNLIKERNPND